MLYAPKLLLHDSGTCRKSRYKMPKRQYLSMYILSIITPDPRKFPIIGIVVAKVYDCAVLIFSGLKWITPNIVQKGIVFVATVIFYIPNKILTVFTNIILLSLGAWRCARLPAGETDPCTRDPANGDLSIKNFSSLISSWKDLFNDDISKVFHSQLFVNWQREQATTVLHGCSQVPRLSIMPEFGTLVTD